MTAEEKYELLTHGNVKKAICRLAVPTIISMLVTSLYNMADSFFVSSLGSGAIGAVGVVFSMMAIIQACGYFFGHGSGNYIARKLGNKDFQDAKQMAATGYYTAFFFGLLILLFGIFFLGPLARLLGADELILPYAKTYLFYILLGAPFMCSSLVMNNQLRFQGNALYAMIGIGSGSLLNILGDYLLVPVLKMHGAGLSTFLSQIIGFGLLRIGIVKSSNVKICWRNFTINKHLYLEILNGGAPSLLRQGIGSIATIFLNHICKGYGTDAVAAMSVVIRITNLPFSVITGFGQGFQPVCGYNYGAKKYHRVRQGYYFTVIVSFATLCFLSALCYFFASPLILLFCRQSDKINDLDLFMSMGIKTLRLHCLSLPLLGLYGPSNMLLQTVGKSIRASALAISRQGIFYIPSLFVFQHSLLGIQLVQVIADVCTFLLSIVVMITFLKEIKRIEQKE